MSYLRYVGVVCGLNSEDYVSMDMFILLLLDTRLAPDVFSD